MLFESAHGPTVIYELVFHPSPVWFKGGSDGNLDEAVCIPPHRGPRYVMGDFRCLLDNIGIEGNNSGIEGIATLESFVMIQDMATKKT